MLFTLTYWQAKVTMFSLTRVVDELSFFCISFCTFLPPGGDGSGSGGHRHAVTARLCARRRVAVPEEPAPGHRMAPHAREGTQLSQAARKLSSVDDRRGACQVPYNPATVQSQDHV